MIDKSTYISVTGHLVVYACVVGDGFPICVFMGLLLIEDEKKMQA